MHGGVSARPPPQLWFSDLPSKLWLIFTYRYAVILAFDVRIERDAQEMADSLGVRIFSAEIIYHLFDAFTKYRQDYKKQKQEEFK